MAHYQLLRNISQVLHFHRGSFLILAKQRYRVTTSFVGDFETTVYKVQTETEVWASALVELYTEDVKIFHSLYDTMYLQS